VNLDDTNAANSDDAYPFRDADVALAELAQACSNLLKLNLSRCGDFFLSRDALRAIALKCTLLRDLDLSWSPADDAGVTAVLDGCHELRMLSLQGCKQLTTDISERLVRAPNLLWCDLSWVNNIDPDRSAEMVVENPRLCVVEYYGSSLSGRESRWSPMNFDGGRAGWPRT
jgi:hypothetical protein